MEKIIDYASLGEISLIDQLQKKLNEQKQLDLIKLQSNNSDFEEYEFIEDSYNLYQNKLEMTEKLATVKTFPLDRYIKITDDIQKIDDISTKKKLLMTISLGVLINCFGKLNELTDNEIIMLAASSFHLDIEDYTYYIGILSNPSLARAITSVSDDLNVQTDVAYEIMDDQPSFDYISVDNYNDLVSNGLDIVSNFEKTNKK